MRESISKTYKGQCLCGSVEFELLRRPSDIYQCHCSECRIITGTSSNASCIVHESAFSWIKGESEISSYTHRSGYRSDFCRTCGSLLPNKLKGKSLYWIPVGALESTHGMEVKAHLCVSSKADWEKNLEAGVQYSEVPSFPELLEVLDTSEENESPYRIYKRPNMDY